MVNLGKVILITTEGKITIVDGNDYKFDGDTHCSLDAMSCQYKLGMFSADENIYDKNIIATNWKYPDRYYEVTVFGDVIFYEDNGDIDMNMLKNILRFIIKDKTEFHRRMKERIDNIYRNFGTGDLSPMSDSLRDYCVKFVTE